MGYALQIDTEAAQPLATNSGWGDVILWAKSLEDADTLLHLCLYGWTEDLESLESELTENLKAAPPEKSETRSTLKNLLTLLQERGEEAVVVSVTDELGE